MFPKTRVFKAVEADKSAFPSLTTLNSPRGVSPSKTLENTPEVAPYNDQFKLRNMQAVRHSFLPGKMSLTALQEESYLRVIKPPQPKKKSGDDDEEEAPKTTSEKKTKK
jgi:hypothetical protein